MRKVYAVLTVLLLSLTGCAHPAQEKNPFQVDTVVRIPVNPTEATVQATQSPETAAQTEMPTEEPAEAPETSAAKPSYSKGSSGSKGSTSGSKKDQTLRATQPPETEPPETLPPTEAPTQPPFDPHSYRVGSLEYAVLDEINAYRAEAGLGALSMDGGLCGIAGLRAAEIALSWSHTRPDGRDYTSAMHDNGYGFGFTAENLIYVTGGEDAAAMVAKWMSSESNSAGILSESCSAAGIGVYRAGGATYVACLLVG